MTPRPQGPARYLVAHPGAELYGSDRVMLDSVAAFVESGADVVVALPETGPLVERITAAGASVELVPDARRSERASFDRATGVCSWPPHTEDCELRAGC